MTPRLGALPIELIEHIVVLLEPRDIGALRLTSRAIENKASKGSFATLFDHQIIRLEPDILRELGDLVSKGRLGCLLRNCTITGIIRAGPEATSDSSDLRTLLLELFRSLKERSPAGCLTSLSLELVAHRVEAQDTVTDPTQDWTAVWRSARSTFEVVMLALGEAQLSIDEKLDIFGNLRGCSLECNAFLDLIRQPATKMVIGSLQGLALSLSLPVDEEHDASEQQLSTIQEPLVLNDILGTLSLMPSLRSFDYHWYTLRYLASPPLSDSMNINDMPSPHLRHCGIRGARLSSSDLLNFCITTRPASVMLADVDLTLGTYAPISSIYQT
ncbi:hypothetical protein BJ170DRAFT_462377 [Xylariales sp. AK1849]|nr:hypothetical protein BJ170DRAFT_462377 [Xylariales sp. AK1849]